MNKTNAILTDVNVNGGEINTASGATTEITADNYLQTLINTEILGSGTVVKNGRTDSTLVLKGDNSQFAGDFEVQAGGVRVEVDNKNKFFNNANVLVEGSSQKLDYISSEISTIANPISLDSAFSNISLKDGATFAITGAGHNASAYSINDGWLVSSEGSNNLVFSNANYLVNTDFSVGGISSNDSIYFQNSIVSFGDALKNTTNYNLGGGQYSIEDSTLNLLDNVAGNNYNFESLNLVGNNNKITIDVDLTLDSANGVVPVADTITANSGSGLVYLSDIFITGDNGILESENGQLSKGVIQIFKGANNLKVAIADNIEVGYRATNYYKYAIESATAPTSQGGHEQDSIRLVAKGITSSDTLRDLNLYNSQTGSAGGNRGFNFIVKDGLQQNNTYNIYRDLDTTTAGNFSIIGQLSTDTNEKSVLDGTLKPLIVASTEVGSRLVQEGSDWYYYEPNSNSNKTRVTDFVTFDSDGNASISPSAISDKTQGSMFELVNATNFSMENITVKNAMRYSDDTIKDGSAIYANNSNAKVSLKNVDFTNNSSAGNGGAIANLNSSSFEIKNSVMSGNTAGGKGGAIYTEADMLITDSDFGVNSLNIDNNATPNDIYIANGAKVTFATSENITNYIMSGLAGGGDFTKTGQGTLELTGHNADLTGTFTLAEGVVKYSKTLAENSFAGGNVKLASNTILEMNIAESLSDTIKNVTSLSANSGTVVKNGAGALNLNGNNSGFTGKTQINSGSLVYNAISADDSYFNGVTEIADGANLVLNILNVDNQVVSGINSVNQTSTSTATIMKNGTGTLNLVGDNSGFTGNVDIDAGSLAYTSNNGSSFFNANTYEIANNAKLVIDNSIADDITIKNLSGKGSIEKSGLGTVTLSGVNNGFRGDLNVAGGMVDFIQTSANDNYILGNTYIAEDAGVSIVNSESALILGNFSGKGNLTIAGLKDVTLKGDNSGLTGDLNIEAGNLIFDADSSKYVSGKTNIANNAGLVINNTSDYQISKLAGLGTLAKNGAGALIIEGDNSDFKGNLNINNGIFAMNVGSAVGVINNATFANGTGIDLQNTTYTVTGVDSYITNPNPASIESLRFNNLRLDGNVDLDIDIDLENKIADNVYARQVSGQGNLILDKDSLNVVSEALYANTVVNVASGALIDRVMLDRGVSSVMGPIQRYNVAYENGNLMFARTSIAPGINDVNPSVMASPIAAQVGGHFMQLDVLHAGFSHMDKYTKHTRLERTIAENANKNAVVDIPLYDESDYLETTKGLWVKPYTTFESVGLKNGSSVSTTSYGSYFGADSDLVNLGKGYHGVISTFAGYNGSYQSFNGINANNNGGALGMTGTLYKGNFFTGLTASAGGSSGEANTYYGTDHYTMMTAGIANKTGYNIEINGGKLIIQPNLFLAYTFVNTFDYTNAAGVRIEQDPLHSVQIVPGIRVIGNLENHWHPYASVNMVWNVLDETKVMANDVRLPHISVKPYVEYGVGIQRLWGDCFTGYFQTMVRNGGRTGVSLSAGFRWAIGLDSDDVKVEKEPKRKVKSNRISLNSQATAPSAAKGTTECKGNTCVEFVKKVLKVKKDIIEIDSL